MKPDLAVMLAAFPLATLAALLAGCNSSRSALAFAPVGPVQSPAASLVSSGTLLVYTAFNTGVPSPNLPDDIRQHTDYELRAEDGKLLRHISNQAGYQSENPSPVPLPAGNYQITARANGYGVVTIPVVISAGRLTELHLEGGHAWPDNQAFNESNSVRLPGGEIIGWKASTRIDPATNRN
jgi:hypothetical protein